MKDILNKAIALGLGLGVTGKEQAEKLAATIEKQLGVTKKESRTIVQNLIRTGEATRKDLDQRISALIKDIVDRVYPVTRKEFEAYKAAAAKKAAPRPRRKARKPAAAPPSA
ncbi:MAG: hypothetical protein N2595_01180 [bacterium]|nr:hypothetical protein [bacterium]